ncbi:MAG TPA: glycosyltransferase [Gallicola sp.]|nr:glycosyltransferase [Gallicola sp.]
MKISIIVPVYNVKAYIDRCLESLIRQAYKDIEIILIDDGSTDGSSEICDTYASSYKHISVIHKENEGLSEARNTGVRVASGDYILFVDSDDYIDENTCLYFHSKLGNRDADIIVGNMRVVNNSEVRHMNHTIQDSEKTWLGLEYLKSELKNKTMHMAAVLCLYKRKFLIENDLFFEYGILHEDEEFTPRVFLKAKEVIATDIVFYNHMIREGSITTQKNLKRNAKSISIICNKLERFLEDVRDEELKYLVHEHLIDISFKVLIDGKLIGKKDKDLINIKFVKKNVVSLKNKFRLFLFNISPRLLYSANAVKQIIRKFLEGIRKKNDRE